MAEVAAGGGMWLAAECWALPAVVPSMVVFSEAPAAASIIPQCSWGNWRAGVLQPWKVQLSTHLLLINSCMNLHPFPISNNSCQISYDWNSPNLPNRKATFFFFFFKPSLLFPSQLTWMARGKENGANKEWRHTCNVKIQRIETVHCSTCCWAHFPEQIMYCQATEHKNMHPQTASPHKSILLKSLDRECTKLKGSQKETEQQFTALVNFH